MIIICTFQRFEKYPDARQKQNHTEKKRVTKTFGDQEEYMEKRYKTGYDDKMTSYDQKIRSYDNKM